MLATSSNAILTQVSSVKWHPLTRRALSISPWWQDSLSYKDSLDAANTAVVNMHRLGPPSGLTRVSRNLALEMVRIGGALLPTPLRVPYRRIGISEHVRSTLGA